MPYFVPVGEPEVLDKDQLLHAAVEQTGLSDFGSDDFRESLDRLVRLMNATCCSIAASCRWSTPPCSAYLANLSPKVPAGSGRPLRSKGGGSAFTVASTRTRLANLIGVGPAALGSDVVHV